MFFLNYKNIKELSELNTFKPRKITTSLTLFIIYKFYLKM